MENNADLSISLANIVWERETARGAQCGCSSSLIKMFQASRQEFDGESNQSSMKTKFWRGFPNSRPAVTCPPLKAFN